jgi:hypothetical protein
MPSWFKRNRDERTSEICLFVPKLSAMSDREGHSGGPPPVDDDLSLPKATVTKMIAGDLISLRLLFHYHNALLDLLPNDVACAKETRDLVIECCVGGHRLTLVAYDLTLMVVRIHPPYILRGKRDMRAGVQEDYSS